MAEYIEQCENYWIIKDDNGYGNALVLRTPWSSRYLKLIGKYKIRIVRLNEYTGWQDSDLSFLLSVPNIHGVDVISDKVTDVSPVFQLENLKTLSLFCKATVTGDFARLKQLQSVSLRWRKAFGSVFNLSNLLSINIIAYPEKDLTQWPTNIQLERLRLESRKLKELCGVDRFPNIRRLHLHRCPNLQHLAALSASSSIQELRVSHCPNVVDWVTVASLRELRVLEIEDCGEIDSIVPFTKCRRLEQLQIAGNTTILNGDLSSLATLPNLKRVLLAHRKHYSHSV